MTRSFDGPGDLSASGSRFRCGKSTGSTAIPPAELQGRVPRRRFSARSSRLHEDAEMSKKCAKSIFLDEFLRKLSRSPSSRGVGGMREA